jgi:hypothetical protein
MGFNCDIRETNHVQQDGEQKKKIIKAITETLEDREDAVQVAGTHALVKVANLGKGLCCRKIIRGTYCMHFRGHVRTYQLRRTQREWSATCKFEDPD